MSDCKVEIVQSRVTALSEGDTLPSPTVTLLDAKGGPVDPSDIATVVMSFEDVQPESLVEPLYTPVSFTVAGVQVGSTATYGFPLTALQTASAIQWRTKVTITENGGGVYTRPTSRVVVVDYNDLWGDPVAVGRLAPDHSNSECVVAILAAEQAVREWVTTPISSPVSERVAHAVALLASRSLTAPSAGAKIVAETMGDYTVRYDGAAPGGLTISGDIADLLRPWRSGAFSIYVGPDDVITELALITEDSLA